MRILSNPAVFPSKCSHKAFHLMGFEESSAVVSNFRLKLVSVASVRQLVSPSVKLLKNIVPEPCPWFAERSITKRIRNQEFPIRSASIVLPSPKRARSLLPLSPHPPTIRKPGPCSGSSMMPSLLESKAGPKKAPQHSLMISASYTKNS